MKKQLASYSTDTVQHVCGYREPTAKDHLNIFNEVDKAFHAFNERKGIATPRISRYHIMQRNELEQRTPEASEAVAV
jgi:hypothetical protein